MNNPHNGPLIPQGVRLPPQPLQSFVLPPVVVQTNPNHPRIFAVKSEKLFEMKNAIFDYVMRADHYWHTIAGFPYPVPPGLLLLPPYNHVYGIPSAEQVQRDPTNASFNEISEVQLARMQKTLVYHAVVTIQQCQIRQQYPDFVFGPISFVNAPPEELQRYLRHYMDNPLIYPFLPPPEIHGNSQPRIGMANPMIHPLPVPQGVVRPPIIETANPILTLNSAPQGNAHENRPETVNPILPINTVPQVISHENRPPSIETTNPIVQQTPAPQENAHENLPLRVATADVVIHEQVPAPQGSGDGSCPSIIGTAGTTASASNDSNNNNLAKIRKLFIKMSDNVKEGYESRMESTKEAMTMLRCGNGVNEAADRLLKKERKSRNTPSDIIKKLNDSRKRFEIITTLHAKWIEHEIQALNIDRMFIDSVYVNSGGMPVPSNDSSEKINLSGFPQHVKNMETEDMFKVIDELKKTEDDEHKIKIGALSGWRKLRDGASGFKDSVEDLARAVLDHVKQGDILDESLRLFLNVYKEMANNYSNGHARILDAMNFSSSFFRKAEKLKKRARNKAAVHLAILTAEDDDDIIFLGEVPSSSSSNPTTNSGARRRKRRHPTENDASEVREKRPF